MGQANTSLIKPKLIKPKLSKFRSTKSPSTSHLDQTLPNGSPRKDEDLPWRISGRPGSKFFVRKLYRGSSTWHQYGWKKSCDKGHKDCKNQEPVVLFTCKMMSKKSRDLNNIDKMCRNIIMTFLSHRNEMHCDCSLEYITKGTTHKISNICETRDKAVFKATKKHDKICTCGAFEFVRQEKGKGKPRKCTRHHEVGKASHAHACSKKATSSNTPTSSKAATSSKTPASSKTPTPPKTRTNPPKHPLDHLKDPFDENSDDEYKDNIFKGLPRKW
jgi:hypothetical protein